MGRSESNYTKSPYILVSDCRSSASVLGECDGDDCADATVEMAIGIGSGGTFDEPGKEDEEE